MTYFAKEENHFVNYIFRKDYSFTRLKNTTKMIDTIGYTRQQFNIVRKLHPEVESVLYGRTTRENLSLHRTKITDIQNLN
jgi:ABC-type phosphate/phosphonate transport system ATPase subunit